MEFIAFMQSTAEKFDCIISADTLVYFGDLLPVFAASVDVLKPGGVFIFTIELTGQSSSEYYRLNPHGRYSHSRQYVADSLAAGGLNLESTDDVVLRKEGGQDVKGLLLVARKKVG
jgi:predicted TPR repeat methyltransferase